MPEDPEERAGRLRELFGVNRVFLGSSDRDGASLVLRDRVGQGPAGTAPAAARALSGGSRPALSAAAVDVG